MLFIWFYRSLNLYFSDYEEKERLVIMERERERERESPAGLKTFHVIYMVL